MTMTKKNSEAISSIIYTTESKESAEKTKADLRVPDPPAEIAKATLENSETVKVQDKKS
jgi:hypothetical protein